MFGHGSLLRSRELHPGTACLQSCWFLLHRKPASLGPEPQQALQQWDRQRHRSTAEGISPERPSDQTAKNAKSVPLQITLVAWWQIHVLAGLSVDCLPINVIHCIPVHLHWVAE